MPQEEGAIQAALPEWVVRKCNPLEARTFQTVLAREAEVSTVVEGVLMGAGSSASVMGESGVVGA